MYLYSSISFFSARFLCEIVLPTEVSGRDGSQDQCPSLQTGPDLAPEDLLHGFRVVGAREVDALWHLAVKCLAL